MFKLRAVFLCCWRICLVCLALELVGPCVGIPGTAEPDGLPSMGSHRVGDDWRDLAMEFRKMVTVTLYVRQQKRQIQRTDFWTLWEKARVG